MRLIYLDESGDDGRNGSKVFCLAGIAVDDQTVRGIQQHLRDLIEKNLREWRTVIVPQMYFKEQFNKPRSEKFAGIQVINHPELHYASLIKGKPPYDKLEPRARKALADAVFEVIKTADIKLFGVVLKKQEHFSKYAIPKPVDLFSLEMMVERCEDYLDSVNDGGILIADARDKHNNKVLQEFSSWLRAEGTTFRKVTRIVEGMMLVPSELCEMVQLADFCSHALFMAHEHGKDSRFKEIRKKFFSVKIFP